MTRATVTPLEALKRLIAVAKWPDAHWFDSEADWNEFQSELAVAEMVVRDYVPSRVELADEVIAALDAFNIGCFDNTWHGWQNGDGAEVGTRLEEALAAYRAAPVAAQPALPKLPSTTAEALDFIGPNFESVKLIPATEGCPEDFRVTLSGHDLLSAFQAYEDAQPADPDDMAANYDHSTHDERMELLRGMRDAQPAVVAAPDWEDRLYQAMDAEFSLRESDKRDEDGLRVGMRNDDTQIGVEFAMKWFKQNMLAAPAIAAPVEVERDAKRFVFEHSNPDAMLKIECKALSLPSAAPIEWWRDQIDAAIATGDKHE